MDYYIYGLRKVGDDEFRYIGQTIDPSRRVNEHRINKSKTKMGGVAEERLLGDGFD